MSRFEFISHSPEETIGLGRDLAKRLKAPVLVLLSGELGSGKTTLAKGIVSGLGAGVEEEVTSPTYTLVHVFDKRARGPEARETANGSAIALKDGAIREGVPANAVKVYHADLYRVENFADLESLALEDALSEPAIVIIEWSERFSLRCDWPRVMVTLEHVLGANADTPIDALGETRRISISAPMTSIEDDGRIHGGTLLLSIM